MNDRRLIEEFLPIETIGEVAVREKVGGRIGHISGLHLWWARRPLAAARAAVFAALVPAPDEIDAHMQAEFFASLCMWGGPERPITEARRRVLEANGGISPRVLDLFAGGGAIPLEASRLGCEATAIELNPVAHVIELCTLDYPQRFGRSLADDVRQWGEWLIGRAKDEIGGLYPELAGDAPRQGTLDGGNEQERFVPVAYLWTRMVPCPNAAIGEHRVPLVRQTWLAKKESKFVALRPVPNRQTLTVSWEIVEATSRVGLTFDPEGFSERGATTCPLCGASVDAAYAKESGKAGKMSADLMGVALVRPGVRGKMYRGSVEASRFLPANQLVNDRLESLAKEGFVRPDGLIAAVDTQHFQPPMYGMAAFGDLFTDRQLAMLLTLCKLVGEAHQTMLIDGVEPDRAKAVATYLGLLIDRIVDFNSSLTTWHNRYENVNQTYARQALSMVWDFPEANPFAGSSGDLAKNLKGIAAVIEQCAGAGAPARVIRASAMDVPLEGASQDAVITDPPYYDNISYADLSDFFYVWLKRSIGYLHPEHLSSPLTPKRSEAIAAPYRHHGNREAAGDAYESMMAQAFSEARRVLKPDGVMVCVYAHQTTAGWATLIEAVRRAGFTIVEAWPLKTELPNRTVGRANAALASSIFLVARPRATANVGDWAHDVRPELQQIVVDRVSVLADRGVMGTDLVIAAIGAGMRAYTHYSRVEKPNGEELSPEEYLEEVEREVTETVLTRIFRTDRAGLGRVDQATQFYVMGRFEFRNEFAPWDELNILGRGTGVEVKELAVGEHALIAFGRKRSDARLRDYADRGDAIDLGRSTIDHLHRVLWLTDNEPERVREYLDAARPDGDRLRLVAQALSRPGLDAAIQDGPETEACQRLLVSWKRLIEDNLFTKSSV